ncbi:MAG: hypothetical protein DID92_2727745432 [Candidatus Nitrotoga sp. SPKER]|nr:MAG: hypothetical protein DID92_2727745432 [Candidatus Nitrotoga sp. SPKER]
MMGNFGEKIPFSQKILAQIGDTPKDTISP